ncbi:hypothetical protein [Halonatronum saccharophilum]|uniref:hypothetical protein n=1 Tax=Halonatronum saccharophilum TaxID=150060 RepID=UPI0004B44B38|nr:hypothetical protein [Halonatronum saccharophilum]
MRVKRREVDYQRTFHSNQDTVSNSNSVNKVSFFSSGDYKSRLDKKSLMIFNIRG